MAPSARAPAFPRPPWDQFQPPIKKKKSLHLAGGVPDGVGPLSPASGAACLSLSLPLTCGLWLLVAGLSSFYSEGLGADSLALHAGVCLGYQHQPGSGSVRWPSPPGVPSQGVGPGPGLACPGVCTGPKSEEASTGPGAASCKGQDLRSQRLKESARDRRAGGPLKLWEPRVEAQLHRIRESWELTSPKPRIRRAGYQRSIWVDRTTGTGRCMWERPGAEKPARAGSGGAGEGTRPAVCPEPGAAVKSWRFGLGSLGPSGRTRFARGAALPPLPPAQLTPVAPAQRAAAAVIQSATPTGVAAEPSRTEPSSAAQCPSTGERGHAHKWEWSR